TLLPANRAVVLDSGRSIAWPSAFLSVNEAPAFIFGNDFQSMGLGLGMAFGAAVARPDLLTMLAIGDGGLMMSLGELDSIIRYGLPVLVVVMNDSAYGAEVFMLRNMNQAPDLALFREVGFAAIAGAAGAQTLTVRHPADLDALQPWLASPDGPMLVDCKI